MSILKNQDLDSVSRYTQAYIDARSRYRIISKKDTLYVQKHNRIFGFGPRIWTTLRVFETYHKCDPFRKPSYHYGFALYLILCKGRKVPFFFTLSAQEMIDKFITFDISKSKIKIYTESPKEITNNYMGKYTIYEAANGGTHTTLTPL